jgi:hypothetical protein
MGYGRRVMDELTNENKRSALVKLLVGCPMGEAVDNCQVRDLRAMSTGRREIAVKTMPPEQIEDILVRHKLCVEKRLADLPQL